MQVGPARRFGAPWEGSGSGVFGHFAEPFDERFPVLDGIAELVLQDVGEHDVVAGLEGLLDLGQFFALLQGARALVANLPRQIAERECQTLAENTNWDPACFRIEEISGTHRPGNIVLIEYESEHVTEVFCGFGKVGVRAEVVAKSALDSAKRYINAQAPVGEYLADQLMLPLGIGAYLGSGGGQFRTLKLSRHSTTHMEVLKKFLDVEIDVECQGRDDYVIRIGA